MYDYYELIRVLYLRELEKVRNGSAIAKIDSHIFAVNEYFKIFRSPLVQPSKAVSLVACFFS